MSSKMKSFFNKILKRRKEYRIGSRPIDSVHGSSSRNKHSKIVNARLSPATPIHEDMQDLQRIVGDFEQMYSSPCKNNESPTRGGNFVKRMVAALEQKYNGRRDTRRNAPRSTRNCVNANEEFQIQQSPMNRTFVIKSRCRSVDRIALSSEQSPFFVDGDHNDITDFTFEIDEGLPSGKKDTPLKKYDQVIEEDGKNFAESCGKSDLMIKREKTPKIVGAFLKKPIEVEETEIHWIPITNQKLPRKSSFKKLLTLLTGKKTVSKGSKLYYPENKTNGKVPECRNSGYDEKTSPALSSVSSKTSRNDKPVHQDAKAANQQKNARVSSFQSAPQSNNNAEKDDYPTIEELARKLMFRDVPRSEVRLSLGPLFPVSVKVDKFSCQETTLEESHEEIYSYESGEINQSFLTLPPLPKHPFVTPLRKRPCIFEHSMYRDHHDSIMSIEEFSSIDLSGMLSRKYPSSERIYDAPRNSLSTSSPDIILKDEQIRSDWKYNNKDICDVPPTQVLVRRKSCIFEDAVSLKRRSIYLESTSVVGSNFYACPDEDQHATVKPRNNKVLPSQELLRSMADNDNNKLQSPYLVNHLSQFNLVF